MDVNSLNENDINQLINYLYNYKRIQHTLSDVEKYNILIVLEQKFNRYPAMCCSIWYNIAGFHLDSCINKMLIL